MIRYLYQLLKRFAGWAFRSDVAATVEGHEPLARFIYSSGHFAETKGIVKLQAFLPDPTGETSVFRTLSLTPQQIWGIGNRIRTEKAKAYGKVLTDAVLRVGLQVNAAVEDHPRHAVIVGWPHQKDRRLMLALQLSKDSSLHVQR